MKKTILPTLFFCLSTHLIFSQNDKIFTHVDQMPYFSGCADFSENELEKRACSNEKLVSFISKNLEYPASAKIEKIEGTVYVSFIIDENGAIIEPEILMDIGGGCGEAALAVIKKMSRWEAGIHNGEKVRVKLNLPIQFSLKKEVENLEENFTVTWGNLKGQTIRSKDLKANLIKPVFVRNAVGDNFLVDELTFIFEKKNRQIKARSQGEISEELEKIITKSKKGGTFTILASIQENGQFVNVQRSFLIIE